MPFYSIFSTLIYKYIIYYRKILRKINNTENLLYEIWRIEVESIQEKYWQKYWLQIQDIRENSINFESLQIVSDSKNSEKDKRLKKREKRWPEPRRRVEPDPSGCPAEE